MLHTVGWETQQQTTISKQQTSSVCTSFETVPFVVLYLILTAVCANRTLTRCGVSSCDAIITHGRPHLTKQSRGTSSKIHCRGATEATNVRHDQYAA